MDSRYLKSLITVVDCGSIADAARVEGFTAAAISQRIQALERQLGFTLLTRTGHAAKPTEACLALLPRARRIVREVALLAGDADFDGLTGALRIGAISTMLTGLLPSALLELNRMAPGIKPSILPGVSRALYQALQANELDAAIFVGPPFEVPKTLRVVVLHTERLIMLSQQVPDGSIAHMLNSHPYIRYDPTSWGGLHAERYLRDAGMTPESVFDLDGLEAIAMLVADGIGVSLVPQWSGLEQMSHNLVITPTEPGYSRQIVLMTPVDSERPRMVTALLAALGHK